LYEVGVGLDAWAGVEPISKDLIDPAKLLANLPSDEELKEAGVVINI